LRNPCPVAMLGGPRLRQLTPFAVVSCPWSTEPPIRPFGPPSPWPSPPTSCGDLSQREGGKSNHEHPFLQLNTENWTLVLNCLLSNIAWLRSAELQRVGLASFGGDQQLLSPRRGPRRSDVHPSSFRPPPSVSVFLRHLRHCVTPLSGKGLRRHFLNDLRLLMRHGCPSRVWGTRRRRHNAQNEDNWLQVRFGEWRVGHGVRRAVRSRWLLEARRARGRSDANGQLPMNSPPWVGGIG